MERKFNDVFQGDLFSSPDESEKKFEEFKREEKKYADELRNDPSDSTDSSENDAVNDPDNKRRMLRDELIDGPEIKDKDKPKRYKPVTEEERRTYARVGKKVSGAANNFEIYEDRNTTHVKQA